MMPETVVTSIRLPRQLKRLCKVEAAKAETTLNQLICNLLESYVTSQQYPTNPPQKEAVTNGLPVQQH